MALDYVRELLVLGLNNIILSLYIGHYVEQRKTISALKAAEQHTINAELVRHVGAQRDQRLGYAIVRGTVKPLAPPIRSAMSPSVTGVLQVINMHEHQQARGAFGMWVKQAKLIHTSSNEVPFALLAAGASGPDDVSVEVIDALSATICDLDVVYDNYEPVSNSLFDNLFAFVLGVRQQGVQTTEHMLRDGSFVTAVGELELHDGQLRLQPSSLGPMMLTTATRSTIVRRLEEAKASTLVRIVFFGAIGLGLSVYVGRKWYAKRQQRLEEERVREVLERERRSRRERARGDRTDDGTATDVDRACVVCVENPKEIICLPCGHVCLCETCATKIGDRCPVCRTRIERKTAAFIS